MPGWESSPGRPCRRRGPGEPRWAPARESARARPSRRTRTRAAAERWPDRERWRDRTSAASGFRASSRLVSGSRTRAATRLVVLALRHRFELSPRVLDLGKIVLVEAADPAALVDLGDDRA